jgi:large subunit ribosomal protein L23Ae
VCTAEPAPPAPKVHKVDRNLAAVNNVQKQTQRKEKNAKKLDKFHRQQKKNPGPKPKIVKRTAEQKAAIEVKGKEISAKRKANSAKKQAELKKASAAARASKKGSVVKRARRVRHSVDFRRPHTLRRPVQPRYQRRSAPPANKLDEFRILKRPLTTESAMKKIEEHKTLVFITDVRANKQAIKAAVKRMYDVKAVQVNTLIRYRHTGCVRLLPAFDVSRVLFWVVPMARRRRTFVSHLNMMHWCVCMCACACVSFGFTEISPD